jgi:hypothetical protein
VFYLQKEKLPSSGDRVNFKGCRPSLRRIMKGLGFQWFRSSRIVLIEKHDIRCMQVSYLTTIKKYQEGHQIVYSYDTYIHSSHTRYKNWSDSSALGILYMNLYQEGNNSAYSVWEATLVSFHMPAYFQIQSQNNRFLQ